MLDYKLIDDDLQLNYREKFGCRITYSYIDCADVVGTPGNVYAISGVTEEEINNLMRESVDSGKNALLERFKDNKSTVKVKLGCDY